MTYLGSRNGPVLSNLVLEIDRIKCDGHGICAELLPELLELDEWGYPIVRDARVPRTIEAHARRAVVDCPVLALRLREVAVQHNATPRPAVRSKAF